MWYQTLNLLRTQDEDAAFNYVQDHWRPGFPITNSNELLYHSNDSYENRSDEEYFVSFGQRYPKESRDCPDEGIYVELICRKNLIDPLIVNIYEWFSDQWDHGCSGEWNDSLSSPDKIYRFSDYINEMRKQANINQQNYLLSTPLNSNIISNDEKDELYAFREIVQYYFKYIQPQKEQQAQKVKMIDVITQIDYHPPIPLLPTGGQKYQDTLNHFNSSI